RRGWESGKLEPGGGPRGRNWKEAAKAGLEENDERMSQIVTIASISAFNRHITAGLAYTASKAGAVLLGKSMATFLAPWGVRSNVIAPGIYPSEMVPDNAVYSVNQIPAGRQGNFNDMAGAILYLVGKSGAY
ncbi:hypothetical protein LTS18_001240, partial [Coniosporium uncinatum]